MSDQDKQADYPTRGLDEFHWRALCQPVSSSVRRAGHLLLLCLSSAAVLWVAWLYMQWDDFGYIVQALGPSGRWLAAVIWVAAVVALGVGWRRWRDLESIWWALLSGACSMSLLVVDRADPRKAGLASMFLVLYAFKVLIAGAGIWVSRREEVRHRGAK